MSELNFIAQKVSYQRRIKTPEVSYQGSYQTFNNADTIRYGTFDAVRLYCGLIRCDTALVVPFGLTGIETAKTDTTLIRR